MWTILNSGAWWLSEVAKRCPWTWWWGGILFFFCWTMAVASIMLSCQWGYFFNDISLPWYRLTSGSPITIFCQLHLIALVQVDFRPLLQSDEYWIRWFEFDTLYWPCIVFTGEPNVLARKYEQFKYHCLFNVKDGWKWRSQRAWEDAGRGGEGLR